MTMILQTNKTIKVVGLGNCDGDMSLRGAGVIDNADIVIVKTALTDTYKFFEEENIPHITCDDLFETAQDFDDLNQKIVEKILAFNEQKIAYCVDGNGADDRSVILLAKHAKVEIFPSVSREMAVIKKRPAISYSAISAYDICGDKNFNYDKNFALIIKEIDNVFIAGQVKEVLSRIVGDEQKIIVYGNCVGESSELTIPVYELDRLREYDYTCGVIIEPIPLTERLQNDYIDLMRIMMRLRGRKGCEWDKAQSHESLRKNVIEEAYELVDAIDSQDIDNIIEESGDVILQGVFHAVIGEDEGEFTANEVLTALCNKLITRHTHIFGDVVANNAEEALRAWENAKAKEKNTPTHTEKLKRISRALPSGIRAVKAQKIASKMGLDFESIDDIFAKIAEETQELKKASDSEKEIEGGDLLFAVINVLRFYGIDAETALNKSVNKFIARVAYVEEKLKEKNIKTATAEVLDKYWEACKALETSNLCSDTLYEYVSTAFEEDNYDFFADETEESEEDFCDENS